VCVCVCVCIGDERHKTKIHGWSLKKIESMPILKDRPHRPLGPMPFLRTLVALRCFASRCGVCGEAFVVVVFFFLVAGEDGSCPTKRAIGGGVVGVVVVALVIRLFLCACFVLFCFVSFFFYQGSNHTPMIAVDETRVLAAAVVPAGGAAGEQSAEVTPTLS